MFWKFLRESFWRPGSRHHALWAVLAVALGTAIAAAMLSVALGVGDKMEKELQSLGANIVITPAADSLPVEIGGIDYRPVAEGAYIEESSLPKLKEIFWRNNITAFAPFLYVPVRVVSAPARQSTTLVGTWFNHPFKISNGEQFHTGIRPLNPTWKVDGDWVDDAAPGAGTSCLAGRSLAEELQLRPGSTVTLAVEDAGRAAPLECTVTGILSTGGAEDNQIFTSLGAAQALSGLRGKARKVQASALIKPEDAAARRDPASMTHAEYERWYCSPYISSILFQIQQALPGTTARQIQPVAETESKVLSKLAFLMATLSILALAAAALSISSIASLRVMKRRQEISLMKAIGAQDRLLASLFLAEAGLQGLAGGVLGFAGGLILAKVVNRLVFAAGLTVNWMLLPVILILGLAVSLVGTWGPLKVAMKYEPATVLRGE